MSSTTANTTEVGADVQPSTSFGTRRSRPQKPVIQDLSEDSDDSQLSAYSRNLKRTKESNTVLKNPFSEKKQSSVSNLSLFKENLRRKQQEAFSEEFEEEKNQMAEEQRLFSTNKGILKKSASFADIVEGDIYRATTTPLTGGISSIIYVKTTGGQLKYGSEVYPGCTVVKFQVNSIYYFVNF